MFIHTEETLEELEDHIKQLEETIGLTASTAIEIYKAINKERDKLKKLDIAHVVGRSEQLKCEHKFVEDALMGVKMKRCWRCGKGINE